MAKTKKIQELDQLDACLNAVRANEQDYSPTFLKAMDKFREVLDEECIYQPISDLEKKKATIAALIEEHRIPEDGDAHAHN